MHHAYLVLVLAVAFEALGTTSLQASQQFSRPWPTLGVAVGFGMSLYLLSVVLRYLPLGITYAVWSGLGICLTAFLGWAVFRQGIDLPAAAGMALIVTGIAVINLYSDTAAP